MKWGVRKARERVQTGVRKKLESEKAKREKFAKIANNKNANDDTRKLAKYRSRSLAARTGITAAQMLGGYIAGEVITGDIKKYAGMSKQQIAKTVASKAAMIGGLTAVNTAYRDALARSVDKRYGDGGKLKPGQKEGLFTRENKIDMGVKAATSIVTVAAVAGAMKMSDAAKTRAANEARMKSWGQNILSERVDNVIWQSPDLKAAIIDNRNR